MYLLIDWRKTNEGYAPALPEGMGFLLLAEPCPAQAGASFGLFECEHSEELQKHRGILKVPEELCELLDSAKDYPPAMALAREYIEIDKCKTKQKFIKAYAKRLKVQLLGQSSSRYFMAQAIKDELGYKRSGGFYWVVGYSNGKIKWVSRDYHIYQDPIDHFDIDADELGKRFGV